MQATTGSMCCRDVCDCCSASPTSSSILARRSSSRVDPTLVRRSPRGRRDDPDSRTRGSPGAPASRVVASAPSRRGRGVPRIMHRLTRVYSGAPGQWLPADAGEGVVRQPEVGRTSVGRHASAALTAATEVDHDDALAEVDALRREARPAAPRRADAHGGERHLPPGRRQRSATLHAQHRGRGRSRASRARRVGRGEVAQSLAVDPMVYSAAPRSKTSVRLSCEQSGHVPPRWVSRRVPPPAPRR